VINSCVATGAREKDEVKFMHCDGARTNKHYTHWYIARARAASSFVYLSSFSGR